MFFFAGHSILICVGCMELFFLTRDRSSTKCPLRVHIAGHGCMEHSDSGPCIDWGTWPKGVQMLAKHPLMKPWGLKNFRGV